MNIAVCLKRVPAADSNIRITPDGAALDFSLSEWALGPFDGYALEAALRARDQSAGAARVLAVSVGAEESESLLRSALALGAAQAIHVQCPGLDAAPAARAAAAALKPHAPALIFCGREAADDGLGLFPAVLAEHLGGCAFVEAVSSCELAQDRQRIVCRRRVEGGEEIVEAKFPAVVSCARMPYELRVPALKARLASKRRALTSAAPEQLGLDAAALAPPFQVLGFSPAPARKPSAVITGPPEQAAARLAELLRKGRMFRPEQSGALRIEKMPPPFRGPVLVALELRAGQLTKGAREALSVGRALAEPRGAQLAGVALGGDARQIADEAARLGADFTLHAHHRESPGAETLAWTEALAAAWRTLKPAAVLMSASALGRQVAPRLAARVGAGLASECVAVSMDAAGLKLTRPVLASRFLMNLRPAAGVPVVIALKPGLFGVSVPDQARAARIEPLAVPAPAPTLRVSFAPAEGRGPDLAGAEVVVCGGAGVGSAQNFGLIRALAEALNAAPAASRAAVDAGFAPVAWQVGQSGKTVSPALYIACGVSGSLQHLAGMRSSRCVVAINTDAEAPIMKWADYAVVGDLRQVLPALTALFRTEALTDTER